MTSSPEIALAPLTPSTLTEVQTWFHDAETNRWLGGPEWPERALKLALSPDRFVWVAYCGSNAVGNAIGLADVEIYDDGTAGIAFVVSPDSRGRGYGKGILELVIRQPELARTVDIRAGIEKENTASIGCFVGAGFSPESDAPDEEGFIYFTRRIANVL